MSGARFSAKTAQRRWLPQGRRGPMPWIIAIMMFLTVLAAACALGLGQALLTMRGDLAGGYTVQIVEANAAKRAEMVRQVEGFFHGETSVRSYRVVLESRLREQLAPWLGEEAQSGDLPIPALIDMKLTPGITHSKIKEITREIMTRAPSARIDAHQSYLAPVEALMRALMWAAAGLVGLKIGRAHV
jgi:cell division transport system permease protein